MTRVSHSLGATAEKTPATHTTPRNTALLHRCSSCPCLCQWCSRAPFPFFLFIKNEKNAKAKTGKHQAGNSRKKGKNKRTMASGKRTNTISRKGDPNEATNRTGMLHTARAAVNTRQVATNTAHSPQRARAPVNKREEALDTARANVPRAAEGQGATNHTPRVGRTWAIQPTRQASSSRGTPRPLVRARPGCIRDHFKHHPEPWKQLVTGVPAHGPGEGRLPSSGARQLEPQG